MLWRVRPKVSVQMVFNSSPLRALQRILALLVCAVLSCATSAKDAVLLKNQASIETKLDTQITLQNDILNSVDLSIKTGDVGGKGDNITTWLLVISMAAVALFYPVVWRPLVQKYRTKKLLKLIKQNGNIVKD